MSRSAKRSLVVGAFLILVVSCLQYVTRLEVSATLNPFFGLTSDIVGLVLLFFIPGASIALLIFRRGSVGSFEWLACGFGINVILLTTITTIAKLAGQPMDGSLIVGASLFFLVVAGAALLLKRPRVEVYNDLPFSLLLAVVIAILSSLLFFCLSGYTRLGPSGYWLTERFEGIDFNRAISRAASSGTGSSFVRMGTGEGRLAYTNDSGEKVEVDLRLLVESDVPGRFMVSRYGREESFDVPQPFLDRGREVSFQNHAVISTAVDLAPGENEIELRYEGNSGEPLPCEYLDFTMLDRQAFKRVFMERYRLVNFVLMYDIMEAEDFASNLTAYPYIYHSSGTPEMEGYAVTNPPLSYIFSSFGYVLLGGNMAAINKVAYAVLTALLFVSFYFVSCRLSVRIPMILGSLSLAVVLTLGVSLHFMTYFMFLCIMIAFCFMLEKKSGWFLLFALMGCLSAWGAYYFCVLGLLCYAFLWREWKWSIKQFAYITLGLSLFLGCLLAYGYSKGVLKPWLDIVLWENFRRFGSDYLYQAGSKACFFKYTLICSGFLPLGLFFKNDRRGCFFLLFSLIYCATLLVAPSNEWKIHYLPTLVFPVMISASRGLALALSEGKKAVRLVLAAIWVAAISGFLYVFYLALKGELIIC